MNILTPTLQTHTTNFNLKSKVFTNLLLVATIVFAAFGAYVLSYEDNSQSAMISSFDNINAKSGSNVSPMMTTQII